MLAILLSLILALVLDRIFGEPRRFHPLVGFGRLAVILESYLNKPQHSFGVTRLSGLLATLLLLMPLTLLVYWLAFLCREYPVIDIIFSSVVLYLVIGGRSLGEHAKAISAALRSNDLDLARIKVGYIVSRETAGLDEAGVARASIESVLENGSDSIFAPIIWFVVGGLVGAGSAAVVVYRIINTLDAMWGYRNSRFYAFGWAPAKLDDLVNWLPARLCALSYALVAAGKKVNGVDLGWQGLHCWRQQAQHCESPNAGPVMACGAGVLNVALGGTARYHGEEVFRPQLGVGEVPGPRDIDRSIDLLDKVIYLWLIIITLFALVFSRTFL